MNIFYVRNDGNDSNDGLRNHPLGAFKSLDYAKTKCVNGDIIVKPDIYLESTDIPLVEAEVNVNGSWSQTSMILS
jgi:hypothetical protein